MITGVALQNQCIFILPTFWPNRGVVFMYVLKMVMHILNRSSWAKTTWLMYRLHFAAEAYFVFRIWRPMHFCSCAMAASLHCCCPKTGGDRIPTTFVMPTLFIIKYSTFINNILSNYQQVYNVLHSLTEKKRLRWIDSVSICNNACWHQCKPLLYHCSIANKSLC